MRSVSYVSTTLWREMRQAYCHTKLNRACRRWIHILLGEMSRLPRQQVRTGRSESRLITLVRASIKTFTLWTSEAGHHENQLNRKFARHLRETIAGIDLRDSTIEVARFAGEVYRPEFYLPGSGAYWLCAFECKKLTRKRHKAGFKEALSQGLLYRAYYKHVFVVFYDFSRRRIYTQAFGRGNRKESQFSRFLREERGIEIISIPAKASTSTSKRQITSTASSASGSSPRPRFRSPFRSGAAGRA